MPSVPGMDRLAKAGPGLEAAWEAGPARLIVWAVNQLTLPGLGDRKAVLARRPGSPALYP